MLNKVLSAFLGLLLIGAIGTVVYIIINPPQGEKFTEFYLLGPDGKAEGYPRQLKTGEQGKLILGITNQEHRRMEYRVVVLFSGQPGKEIGPIELSHKEKWEDFFRLSLQEPSADTRLVEPTVNYYGPYLSEQRAIRVASAENLKVGDYVWIGEEGAQIDAVDGNTITLKEQLRGFHEAGQRVIERQKIEFMLYKNRQLRGKGGTDSFSLWLGREHLNSAIQNGSSRQAAYLMKIKVKARMGDSDQNKTVVRSFGPLTLGPEQKWEGQLSYPYPEASWQNAELFLYRNGDLVYNEEAFGGYPSLHLWVDVVPDDVVRR